VRAELLAQVMDARQRLFVSARRLMQHHATTLQGLGRGLGDPRRLLEQSSQRLDHLATRLDTGLTAWLERRRAALNEMAAKISPRDLRRKIADAARLIATYGDRLHNTETRLLKDRRQKLSNLAALLESLSFERVLERGYAVVFDGKGGIVSSAAEAEKEKDLTIRFKDGKTAVRTGK
jgi:exodeoxyribonuclease VII large subunit